MTSSQPPHVKQDEQGCTTSAHSPTSQQLTADTDEMSAVTSSEALFCHESQPVNFCLVSCCSTEESWGSHIVCGSQLVTSPDQKIICEAWMPKIVHDGCMQALMSAQLPCSSATRHGKYALGSCTARQVEWKAFDPVKDAGCAIVGCFCCAATTQMSQALFPCSV